MVIIKFDLYTGLHQYSTYTKAFPQGLGSLILQTKEIHIAGIGRLAINSSYFETETTTVIVNLKPCASYNLSGAKQSMFDAAQLEQVQATLKQNNWTLL